MRALALILFLTVGGAPLSAHGGEYRGPTTSTGARDNVPIPGTWQRWWETQREPLMREKTGPAAPVTGARRDAEPVQPFAITADDRGNRIVPALLQLLASENHRDVQTAGLMALAKIGIDGAGTTLESVFLARLSRDDLEVRETAALALGIAGRAAAVAPLLALLLDEPDGRKLVGARAVPDRVRAFAAYGLALLARRRGEPAVQEQAAAAFWKVLRTEATGTRDLRTACVLGLGALRDADQPEGKRLAWQIVDELLVWLAEDRGPGEEIVQAQAPLAIARLLGRGDSPLHRRGKKALVGLLTADSRRGNALLQSAAIALGLLALPAEVCAEDGPVSTVLQKTYDRGAEPHVRLFAVIALARIGGDGNRAWLLAAYPRGNQLMEQPWLALALGVLARDRARGGDVDAAIGKLLFEALAATGAEDLRAPLAVAVGLTKERAHGPRLRQLLLERADNERFAGYLCTGLGLLGDPAAVPDLAKVLDGARRRPFVLQSAAVALGQLGDREIPARLIKLLAASDSIASAVGLSSAIGRIGDRRAIDPLLALVTDAERPVMVRAFTAAALGWLGDKDPLPWNLPFAADANYAVEVDTLSNGSTGILDIL
jgi:HEAT repeat protein